MVYALSAHEDQQRSKSLFESLAFCTESTISRSPVGPSWIRALSAKGGGASAAHRLWVRSSSSATGRRRAADWISDALSAAGPHGWSPLAPDAAYGRSARIF